MLIYRLELIEQENLNLQKTIHERERKDNDIIGALSDQMLRFEKHIEELKKEHR